MLTTGQVDHFRTFGFTVLRGYLADRISALAWTAVYQRCPETGPNASGLCVRCMTASSRRSAASTPAATPSGGTGSPVPPRIRAGPG